MTMYALFAAILDYPETTVVELTDKCAAELRDDPEACEYLSEFRNLMADKTLGQTQEAYTNAFDLRPECTPNLGYHIFGDDARRGVFLAELKGRMDASGISTGTELPDFMSLILRYLDMVESERAAMIEDCLLPSVSKMTEVLAGSGNPYEPVLRALLCFLRGQQQSCPVPADEVEA